MKKTKKEAKAMREFADAMRKVYNDAEVLRDCTNDHVEKEIFNKTRNVLYDLVNPARYQAQRWEQQAGL